MATAVAEPPVRLVKMIGDAAMLVSTDAEPLLVGGAAPGRGGRRRRRASSRVCGPASPTARSLVQSGDYYGRPVNLASRITGVARPGSVLVDEATKEAAGEGFAYSFAGERRLKGFDSRVKLFRVRREP